jgi:DNA mismatch repair protein MutS2
MRGSERDIATFLAGLHQRLDEISGLEEELKHQKESLAAREQALAKEWSQRESAKLKELDRRADLVLEKFEAQARETIEAILQGAGQKKAADRALRRVAAAKREFREEIETTVLSTLDQARCGELDSGKPKIVEGAKVRLKGVREPARVRRMLGEDLIEVEAGFARLQVPVEDVIEVLPDTSQGARLPQGVSFRQGPEWTVASREIKVIGQRAEEACQAVDKFLDSAVVASVSHVRIVHGHGMGILRRAIAELLSNHPHVEKFYAASQNEGGTGATVVELKGG